MVYMMQSFRAGADGPIQREYRSRRSAERYAKRHGLVIVDHWPADDPPPRSRNDAQAWDDWRLRRGVSGSHS